MTYRGNLSPVMRKVLGTMKDGYELHKSPQRVFLWGYGVVQIKTFDALLRRGLIKRAARPIPYPAVLWVLS